MDFIRTSYNRYISCLQTAPEFLQSRALFVGQVIIRGCQYTGIPVADKLQIDASCGLVPEQSQVRSSW